MIYLKRIIGLILVLAVLFFLIGLFVSSVSYKNTVTVNMTPEEARAAMQDESKHSEWLAGFIRSELVSGEKLTVGAVSDMYVEQNGTEMVMQETITAVKENEHMAMTFAMDFMNMDYEMNFEEQDGKTIITSKSTVQGNHAIARSMVAIMKGGMTQQEQENLDNFKKIFDPSGK